MDAKLDPTIPAFSTVQTCLTSMVGVFEAAGMLSAHAPLALVGGVEAMSQVQIGLTQGFSNWLRSVMQARTVGRRLDAIANVKFKDIRLDIPSVKIIPPEMAWASMVRTWCPPTPTLACSPATTLDANRY